MIVRIKWMLCINLGGTAEELTSFCPIIIGQKLFLFYSHFLNTSNLRSQTRHSFCIHALDKLKITTTMEGKT